jgi:hypothetical protein
VPLQMLQRVGQMSFHFIDFTGMIYAIRRWIA